VAAVNHEVAERHILWWIFLNRIKKLMGSHDSILAAEVKEVEQFVSATDVSYDGLPTVVMTQWLPFLPGVEDI